jgi:predicted RNase H-like nuclease
MGKIGLQYGFKSLPESPGMDRTGLKMQIVTAKIMKGDDPAK